MRVALLLQGQYRNAKECFPSIKEHILDVYQPDIFISSWHNPGTIINSVNLATQGPPDDSSISDIIEMYNPASFLLEDYSRTVKDLFTRRQQEIENTIPINELNFQRPWVNLFNIEGMWYKVYTANQLKKEYEKLHEFKYDLVIKSRFDLQFLDEFKVPEYTDNDIIIPKGFGFGGYCDLLAAGSSKAMDYYCDIYHYMQQYFTVERFSNIGPENIMKKHLEDFNVILPEYRIKFRNFIITERG